MDYKAIYAQDWDLGEAGVNAALNRFRALGEGGLSEVAFYNWGHLRDVNLNGIADGLTETEKAA